jgi:hypothetical protein
MKAFTMVVGLLIFCGCWTTTHVVYTCGDMSMSIDRRNVGWQETQIPNLAVSNFNGAATLYGYNQNSKDTVALINKLAEVAKALAELAETMVK